MYILRNEPFGGSIFNQGENGAPRTPSDGTLIHLDEEAFASVCKGAKGSSLSPRERSFLEEVEGIETWIKDGGPQLRLADLSKARKISSPFMVTHGPELVDFQITNRCNSACPHCYVDSQADGRDAPFSDVLYALDKMKEARVLQVAFGGGEPTVHPLFPRILQAARDRGMVPNYTTNARLFADVDHTSCRSEKLPEGLHTESPAPPAEILEATKEFCGAIAFSVEDIGDRFEDRRGFPFDDFKKAAQHVGGLGINLVFQITVGESNIQRIRSIVNELSKLDPYGILFLAYKPIGRGKNYDRPIAGIEALQVVAALEKVFENLKGRMNVGFDSCFAPALACFAERVSYVTYEGCTGARTSLAISPELDVMPCSFIENLDGDENCGWENLRAETDLIEIWYGRAFEGFRQRMASRAQRDACANCAVVGNCWGGCPAMALAPCTRMLSEPRISCGWVKR